MTGTTTIVAGIEVPSVSPIFLTVVGFHVIAGIACVIVGMIAMLSQPGTSPDIRYHLLLVPVGGFCFRNCPGRGALGRGLPPVHSWGAVLRRCISWPHGSPATLAQLGQIPHHRHGPVIHLPADGVLRRQRTQPAALERTPCDRLLAIAQRVRDTTHHACPSAASAGTAVEPPAV